MHTPLAGKQVWAELQGPRAGHCLSNCIWQCPVGSRELRYSLRGASPPLPVVEDLDLVSSRKLVGSFSGHSSVLGEGMGQKRPCSAGAAKAGRAGAGMF